MSTAPAPLPFPKAPAGIRTPPDHVLILFGATGDLAKRKLLPGLFHLAQVGLMPERFRIVATSRGDYSDDQYRGVARSAVDEFGRGRIDEDQWHAFAQTISYISSDAERTGELAQAVAQAEEELAGVPRRLHYLSVPPAAFADITRAIGAEGLNERTIVILEKPFGYDLESAQQLNALIHEVFDEEQVYRIDHFLGKEAVQNVLAVRFANGMFEPVWNRTHIDHVQIDVPEDLGIGMRAAFYEQTGAFRDMVVTHLFQMLGFVAMEPPTMLGAKQLVTEKTKVFESMRALTPADVVRGQYEGYRDEQGVAVDSDTETFVAVRCWIDNWRWSGVPFFLRTGKRMAKKAHMLTIAFKKPPRAIFPEDCSGGDPFGHDKLVFDLSDPGGMQATFLAKRPGPTMQLGDAAMTLSFATAFESDGALEAYERLIHDAMIGDKTLFTTADGIERLWELSMPLLDHMPPLHPYPQGSWGPEAATELIAPRHWALPEPGPAAHTGSMPVVVSPAT